MMLRPEINSREKEKEIKESHSNTKLKFKIRFDYKGKPKPARFFFGGKKTEDVAQEFREQQVARWRNIPLQGITVENIDPGEIYNVYDEEIDEEIAYAPLELLVTADSLEDLLRFIFREEFRRIEVLEPSSILLDKKEIERLLFRVNEFLQTKLLLLSRE
ncbi:MAG: hypothetical protein ACOX1X_10890 [Dethiobacteria bacterium]|jgi:hypothetical protein